MELNFASCMKKFTRNNFLLLINAAAMVTALACYEPCLYYAERNAIRRVQLQNSTGKPAVGTTIQTTLRSGQYINSIALDHFRGRIFWYDIFTRMIYKANLDGSGIQVLIRYGVSFCEGIAYDWSTDNIYWTDSWHDWIEVARSDGSNRKILISGNMQQPRGIIVDPIDGYLYWTEFGQNPRIERSRLDGTERKVIATGNLRFPNDVQIDFSAKRLYWIDAYTDKIESSDYDGKNRRIVTDVSYYGRILMHPYSMALFAQHSLVYFTDWFRSWVMLKATTSDTTITTLYQQLPRQTAIGQIRVLHSSNQPPATSSCLQNRGNCSHLCLSQGGMNYTCQCSTGWTLTTVGGTQCQRAELDYQIFVVDGSSSNSKIFHLSKFVGQPQYQFEVVQLPQRNLPVGLDFDQDRNIIYWSDVGLNKIFKMHINGSGFTTVTDKGIETPEGLQIDYASGLIYVADYYYERIEVIKLDGSLRMDLITTDLINPRDLVLYHEKGVMFYSDWQDASPKIESAYMDGTNRKRIITTEIGAPSGLAIDKIEQRLYWSDMQLDRIESSNLQGTDRRILFDHDGFNPGIPLESVTGEIQTPYGLTLHRDKVFWTDWTRKAVYSADKRIGGKIDYITSGLEKPMQAHAYSKKQLKEYKKLFFFSRAKIDPESLRTHSCFSKNCTGTFARDPALCPIGYTQTRFSEICANCSAPFGVYNLRCECKNWMSCAHRAYSKLSCPTFSPFMHFKVRECAQAVNPGFCPNKECPTQSSPNCTSDGDCLNSQKCCNTTCGMKCLSSTTNPAKHQCQINNGGCSHFCLRVPNNFTCGCPNTMILQKADNKTCILKTGLCATKKPCSNGGLCQDTNTTSYVCKCKDGYIGRHCESCIECPSNTTCTRTGSIPNCNCLSNACRNNGTCTVFQNKTVCHCPQGFTGERCENSLLCPSNFCNGHGVCFKSSGTFKCNCSSKYSGKNCETLVACMTKDCKNNGTCTAVNDAAFCNCTEQFTGANCEVFKECLTNPCANGGTCSNQGNRRICTCKPGYTGAICESKTICYVNPCLNNGTCFDSDGKSSCRCKKGYTGDHCQNFNPCLLNPCKNNSTCSVINGAAKCTCSQEFTGQFCESVIPCSNDFCKNGGTCLVSNNRRQCNCPVAYTGANCETHIMCSSNPCMHGGNCTGTSINSFKCSCLIGFVGTSCQFHDRCLSRPCKNGGFCASLTSVSGYTCTCTRNTTGTNCESINPCASNPCLNNGYCSIDRAEYTCYCAKGYKGKNCATRDYCISSACRQSSMCVNGQNGYTCSCDMGYTGQYCNTRIDYCGKGNYCKNNGFCTSTLEKATCVCDDFYGGERCEVYYGESIFQVSMDVLPSSKVTAETIKTTLADGYTAYCKTTDCTGNTSVKRKRRDAKNPVVVTSNDIMIVKGYPKQGKDASLDVQFAVIINTGGKSIAMPPSLLTSGFDTVKGAFARSLNITVRSYQTITTKKPDVRKSKSDESSKSGGLAAGLIVLILALIFITIVAVYTLRKRRREKETNMSFNAFDNVLYQSSTDLQMKQEPNVQIHRRSDNEMVNNAEPLQFDNNVYDARRIYSEKEDLGIGNSFVNHTEATPVKTEMRDGMTGMVNPYADVPEAEKKIPYVTRTDSTTIVSSTNLKAAVLASLDEDGVTQPEIKGTTGSRVFTAGSERPVVVKVRSVSEDSADGLSGFANPCAAVDDYIFSEDDTREALDIPDRTGGETQKIQGSSDQLKTVSELNANEEGQEKTELQRKGEEIVHGRGNWVALEKDANIESNA